MNVKIWRNHLHQYVVHLLDDDQNGAFAFRLQSKQVLRGSLSIFPGLTKINITLFCLGCSIVVNPDIQT